VGAALLFLRCFLKYVAATVAKYRAARYPIQLEKPIRDADRGSVFLAGTGPGAFGYQSSPFPPPPEYAKHYTSDRVAQVNFWLFL